MKRLAGVLSVCCVLGVVVVPALGQTMALVPQGTDPDGAPYAITARGNDTVPLEVFVRDSGVPVQSMASTLFCSVGGGDAGSIDFHGLFLDEIRSDYIFAGRVTAMWWGAIPSNCPDGCRGQGSPTVGTLILMGTSPLVTDWKYMGEWNLLVSSDARGTFTVRFVCSDCPANGFCDPDQNAGAGCTAALTFIGDDLATCIPLTTLHPLTITVPTGSCCVGQTCTFPHTQWECEDGMGGVWREGDDCSLPCPCTSDPECDDGLACTDDSCVGLGGTCPSGPVDGQGCCHEPTVCQADTDCATYACTEPGGCTATPLPAGTPCTDDGDRCTDDFCGSKACTHPRWPDDDDRACGACCYQVAGKCFDDLLADECLGDVWSANNLCDTWDHNCEKVIIPTVSEWGLLVISLLLLVGIGIKFGRRRTARPSV